MKKKVVKAVDLSLLKKEIEMQMQALRRIQRWINYAITLSAIGVLFAYVGYAQKFFYPYAMIAGIIIIVIGLIAALVLGYGEYNGRANVEKMINILEAHLELKDKNKS